MFARRHVPIQPYLTALFAAITLVIGLSTAALFYDRMKTASLNEANLSFDRISANIAQQLLQVRLEIQYELALLTASRLAKAQTFAERVAAKDDLIPLMNANRLVYQALVGYPNGDFIRVSRVDDGDNPPRSLHGATAYVMHTVQLINGKSVGHYWFYDRHRKLLAVEQRPITFDVRTRPWYQASTGAVTVTEPFVFASSFHIGYSVSQRSTSGSVLAANVDLESTPEALSKYLPTPSAIAAGVRAATGVVFALSNPKMIERANTNRLTPATINDLGSPPLAAAYKAAVPPNMETSGSYRDPHGRVWLYRVTPAKAADGRVILFPQMQAGKKVLLPRAVLVLAAPEDEIIASATRVRNAALVVSGALLVAMFPIAFWFSQLVSRPLRRLGSEALALRNLDFTERPTHDSTITELNEFAETFGAMRTHIREYNDAVANFVPRQFLELLGRKDLKSLKLGDHHETVMTMLFSDIRSFTTLSGDLTPAENFRFVNSYLTQIGPIIRERNGFIDKYIGDGIFALFPDKTRDSVDAAIEMQQRVVTYNEGRARAGYIPIAIGVGLHRGRLMLGTIGESQRYDTTVISDAVNIASRMESLTKSFGALILTSAEVMEDVDPSDYCTRRLGDVLVKGATRAVTVYEVFDADPPGLLAHKRQTLADFERGRLAFAAGDFKAAEQLFGDIVALDPDDRAALYYRDRAVVLATTAFATPWDGVEHMETK